MQQELKLTPKEVVVKNGTKPAIVQPQVAINLNLPILYTGTRRDCQTYINKHG